MTVRQCHNGRTFQALVFLSCYNWQGPIQDSTPMSQWPNVSGSCFLVLLYLAGPYTGQYANVTMAERFRLMSSCLVIIGRALYRTVRQCHNDRTFQALVFLSCYNWQGPIQGSTPMS